MGICGKVCYFYLGSHYHSNISCVCVGGGGGGGGGGRGRCSKTRGLRACLPEGKKQHFCLFLLLYA